MSGVVTRPAVAYERGLFIKGTDADDIVLTFLAFNRGYSRIGPSAMEERKPGNCDGMEGGKESAP